MYMDFQHPSILSDEEWKLFDPTKVSNKIAENIAKAKNNKEISEKEIIEVQANLIGDLYELNFLITENIERFQDQGLTQLIMRLDTTQPSSRVWEKNREFAVEVLNYLSLILKMSIQAQSAAGKMMSLYKK